MKIRSGYVSNSSSSSFIIFGDKPSFCDSVKLPDKVVKNIMHYLDITFNNGLKKDVYLTKFIYDDSIEQERIDQEIKDGLEIYEYLCGELNSEPYDTDGLYEIEDNIWIRIEDSSDDVKINHYRELEKKRDKIEEIILNINNYKFDKNELLNILNEVMDSIDFIMRENKEKYDVY